MSKTDDNRTEDQSGGLSLSARAVWFVAARTLAFAFSFGLPLLLVRRLDQHQFGLYKQVFLLAVTAINVLPIGIEMSAFYFLPRVMGREEKARVILNILIFYVATTGSAAVALGICPWLLSGLFNNPELAAYAPLIAVMIPLWGAPFVLETIAIANQQTRLASVFIVTAELCKALLLGCVAVFAPSLKTILTAGIIHGAVQAIVLAVYVIRRFGYLFRFNWPVFRAQLSYALPFGFAAILFRLQVDLHNYYVSRHFSPAEYAIYAVGCFNLPLISILAYSVGGVLMPRVNYLEKLGKRKEIIELCARTMRKISAIYFPIYIYLAITGREFLSFLFTKQYLGSWPVFMINLTMIPLALVTTVNDSVMRAHAGQRYFLLRLRVLLIPALLAGLWFGTTRLGLMGAISAVVAVSLIEAAATGFRVTRLLGVESRDIALLKDIGRLAVASIVAGIAAALLRLILLDKEPFVVLALCAVIFSMVYPAAVLLMNVVTPREMEQVRQAITSWPRFLSGKRVAEAIIEEG